MSSCFSCLPSDPTFTVESVTRVMKKIDVEKVEEVWKTLLVYSSVYENTQQHYSPEERGSVCVDIYVHCNPWSSWEHLAKKLYYLHQVAAAEEVRCHLPPKG